MSVFLKRGIELNMKAIQVILKSRRGQSIREISFERPNISPLKGTSEAIKMKKSCSSIPCLISLRLFTGKDLIFLAQNGYPKAALDKEVF